VSNGKERVELWLYFPFVPSWQDMGWLSPRADIFWSCGSSVCTVTWVMGWEI